MSSIIPVYEMSLRYYPMTEAKECTARGTLSGIGPIAPATPAFTPASPAFTPAALSFYSRQSGLYSRHSVVLFAPVWRLYRHTLAHFGTSKELKKYLKEVMKEVCRRAAGSAGRLLPFIPQFSII